MAADFNEQLDRIRSKMTVVVEKYNRLKETCDTLRRENNALRADLLDRDKQLEQLRMRAEYLSIASTVKVSGGDIDAARAMIADLVREIDRCVADLDD